MAPLAPGLLSTITGTPRISDSLGASVRAITSLEPPGVKPTTMVTPEGQICALAANASSDKRQASAHLAAQDLLPREKCA